MARVNHAASPTKALGRKESRIRKSLDAAAAVVEQKQLILIAAGVATCMILALNPHRFVDMILLLLLFAPYPPFIRHCRWLLLIALLSASVWWKVKYAVVFACFSIMASMDWEYAVDRVKNAHGIQI